MTAIEKPMKFLVADDERDVEMLFKQKFRKEIRNRLILPRGRMN